MAGFIVIPGPLVEEGLCRRSSNPGSFEVPGKCVEVARKCGLQKPACSIHVVDGNEREGTHHLETLADIRARNLVFRDQVGLCEMLPEALFEVEVDFTKNSEREYSENDVTPNSAK